MNPLSYIHDARRTGLLPDKICDLVEKRFSIVVAGINRIEKASGLHYPIAYVEPTAILAKSPNAYQYGIFYARTIPLEFDNMLKAVIQISAPLVVYGLKGTIHAILAHEFLHYLELLHRVTTMSIISDEISGNMFENVYSDSSHLFEPSAIFTDRTLINHITKKFPSGFRDYKLEDKTVKFWIKNGLPRTSIDLDANTTKLSARLLSKVKFDEQFKNRLNEFVEKSNKIQKRQTHKLLRQT